MQFNKNITFSLTQTNEKFVMTVVCPTGHIMKELWKQMHIEGGVS